MLLPTYDQIYWTYVFIIESSDEYEHFSFFALHSLNQISTMPKKCFKTDVYR